MEPSQVRHRILEEHQRIRELLADVRQLASRVVAGDVSCAAALRERGKTLQEFFRGHLDLEDAILIPALREADAWGPERADRVGHEHAEQRQRMDAVARLLAESGGSAREVANALSLLADRIEEDMIHEERAVLDEKVLRDDPINVDTQGG